MDGPMAYQLDCKLRYKHRLTTCQQQRSYVGCKRYSDLLGVKSYVGGFVSQGLNTAA